MARRRFRHEDYGVGWVCALPVELAAAQVMLDEEHEPLGQNANDTNLYTPGKIGEHNVVIACLPAGQMGTNSTAAVAIQMKSTFKSIRFGLMVGIGGGVPSAEADIRLGDVVISRPYKTHGGVVQYDSGKTTPSGIERTGTLNTPPTILLNAVSKIQANHLIGRSRLSEYIFSLSDLPAFAFDNAGSDVLFEASYDHMGGATCNSCSKDRVIERQPRGSQEIVVHYGTIASGNQVMRDGATRDRVSAEFGGVLCFEMEAAGLMNSFPCLVIRGICDYADSHKNKMWQAYAAGTAAAYAKELLSVIPPAEMVITPTIDETIEGKNGHIALPAIDFMSPLTLPNIIKRPEWRMLLSKSKIAADDLFERLSDYDYQRAYRWRRNRKLENTAGWILKNPDFLAWLGGQGPQCLWLSGIVGCGKSITMTTVIEATVENAQSVSRPVFQFIYDHSFRRHLTARALFESYTKQLLVYMERSNKACPSTVITRILEFYGPKRRRPDVQELIFEVLIPLFKMVEATGATFLVDGVDECSQQEAQQVLWGLRQLLESRFCRVFICCREEVNVLQGIPGANRIWITAKDTKADMEVFVDNEIKRRQQDRSISSNEAVLNTIRHEIQNKADGMFLWAQYQIKMLWEDCTGEDSTDEVVYKTLKMLPKDLNETYEQCLAKVNRNSKRRPLADRILKWICVSLEPFKIIQLQEALAVNPDTGELGQDLIHKEEIMTCCASLAFLEKDGTEEFVLLTHHSVRQFLFPLGAESTYRIAQVELGELCVIHLYRHRPVKQLIDHAESSRKSIETLPISRSYVSTIGSVIAPGIFKSLLVTRSGHHKSVPIRFPKPISRNAAVAKETGFLSYAKTNWMLLTPNLSSASRQWSLFKNLALPNDRSWDIYPWPQRGYHSLDSHVFQLYAWSITNSHYSLLSIAIGQQGIVRRNIFNLPLFDHIGQQASLPLPAAATTGDTEIVASLLKIMPKVNEQHSDALHAASSKGYLEVVQLLLNAGTPVNTTAGYLGSALEAARRHGHDQVVQYLIDVGADSSLHTLKGHTHLVLTVAFSPDGRLVASGSDDATIRLWDVKTGAPRHTLKGHTNSVRTVAFSPDGQLVASGSIDATIRLWDAKTGAPRHTLKGHTSSVWAVALSPDGQLVASGSDDATARLWDAKAGTVRHTLKGHTNSVWTVAFSPDGQLVASGSDDATIRLWDVKTGAPRHTLKGHTNSVWTVSFSPDGQLVTSGSDDATIRLWDAKAGTARHTLKGHTNSVRTVAFSPDGQLVASGSNDATIRLWDAKAGTAQHTLKGHTYSVRTVAFSPDGQLVASGSNDETIRLWDAKTGTAQHTLKGHTDLVWTVAFPSDGQLVASGSDDVTVRLWAIR